MSIMHENMQSNFKEAFSLFSSSISIVSIEENNIFHGLTINSLISLSINPVSIIWSLDKKTFDFDKFKTATSHNISLLNKEQINIAKNFAFSENKIIAADLLDDKKLLKGRVVGIKCQNEKIIDIYDHVLIVGKVIHIDHDASKKILRYEKREFR